MYREKYTTNEWDKYENAHCTNMPQLSDTEKARALALREAGVLQIEVARRIGVTVKTIQRLEKAARNLKPGEVPSRKVGTGRKRKYGPKEVKIIEKLWDAKPGMTATQMKLSRPKQLGHLSRRTVSNILREDLDLKSCVKAEKPYLTDQKKSERLSFARSHEKWSKSKWGNFLFADEKFFWTKNSTSGRRVRRPVGRRYDPKFTKKEFKKPQKIMFWAGIASNGRRISRFLDINEKMNSNSYIKVLRKAGAPSMLREVLRKESVF